MTRVLLTGSNGFVGRRVKALLPSDIFVCCLDRNIPEEAEGFGPDVVIHCAWPGVEHGRDNDDWQIDGLVLTERLIADYMRGCKRWVACGSQAEMSTPSLPYAVRKSQAHLLTEMAADFHVVGLIWARLFSVYGPGEYEGTFTSYLIHELLAGRDPALTEQDIPWDFLYVDDAARALIHLALSTEFCGQFDVANGTSIRTKQAARWIRDKINPKASLRFGARPRRPVEIDGLYPNITRLLMTGWKPQVSFSQGIDRLIKSLRA